MRQAQLAVAGLVLAFLTGAVILLSVPHASRGAGIACLVTSVFGFVVLISMVASDKLGPRVIVPPPPPSEQ